MLLVAAWSPVTDTPSQFGLMLVILPSYTVSGSNVTQPRQGRQRLITVNGIPTSHHLNGLKTFPFSGSSEDFTTQRGPPWPSGNPGQ